MKKQPKKAASSTKKRSKRATKKKRFFDKHPLIVPVMVFLALFFGGMVSFIALGASTQGPADARIVNLFADSEQRTVTTRAQTVDELLDRLAFPLAEEDIVEPALDTLILEDNTQVNIYRARPVDVIDGDRIISIVTAQRAPRLAAEEAGVSLLPEDDVAFTRAEISVLESSASEQLVVTRSVPVTFSPYGALKTIRTTATTVAELLEEQGVTPGESDTVQPGVDAAILPDMLIAVNRPGVKTEVVSEPIPFSTEVKNDDSLQAGRTNVEREGVEGERAVIYEIREEDGIEVSRIELQQVVLREPVSRIELRGTKIVSPSFNPTVTVAGDKAALMAAAGIAESDFGFVDYIISKESGWRPGAVNSSSGAYGLCQSLPASKMASAGADYLTNPITQLRWCAGYAAGRYGGWGNAYQAWLVQRWW